MTTEQTQISAAANPALANKLVEEALSEQAVAVPAPAVKIQLPPDTQVELPGGLFDPFEGTITTAEIRELNGADEEAISKINDAGKALLAILERATVKIGDKPADKETLDSLLAGDREMILLAIRKATFGTEIKLELNCPFCNQEQIFNIDLDKDVEVKKLEGDDIRFEVDCKIGTVVLSLPNGATQRALVSSNDKTSAELDTVVLKSCISSINGMPILNIQQVRDLSVKDRRELLSKISDRNPGPQLSEIKKECMSCGQGVPLPLTLADLFR
jgi:hypothetical protein